MCPRSAGTYILLFFIYLSISHTNMLFTAENPQTLANAYFNLAQVLQDSKNIKESLINYKKVLDLDPTHTQTLLAMGTLYLSHTKEYDKAICTLEKRLKIESSCYNTHFLLAQAYQKDNNTQNNTELALKHYKSSVKINPHFFHAYKSIIKLLIEKNKINQAIKMGKNFIEKNKDTKNYNNIIYITEIITDLLISKNRLNEALVYTNKLIKHNGVHPGYQLKKAKILALSNQLHKAIKIFENLSKLQPNNIKILYNIGHLYKKVGEYEKAIHLFKKVIEKEARHKNALLGISHSYLCLGYYKNGWQYMHQYNSLQKNNILLSNIGDIRDKIILIKGEWYSEDMIQLMRYVQLLKEYQAKSIIIQVPQQLVSLFRNSPFIDHVISIDKRESCIFDRYIPISSLPHLFNTTKENIPCNIPYIYPDKKLTNFWDIHFPTPKSSSIKNIGIYITKDSPIGLSQLVTIANQDNIHLYILNNLTEKNTLSRAPNDKIIYTFGRGFDHKQEDVSHLAALLPYFDLFITCDCFAAHLAGALGVKTLVILQKITGWHWICNSSNSPWYPTVRLLWPTDSCSNIAYINSFLQENLS